MVAVSEPILGGFVICRPAPITYHYGKVVGFTLMSDLHVGAASIDYERIKQELKTAKEKGDRIAINGDVFDMILTGDRKRFSMDALHPKLHGRTNIINAAIEMGAELLASYVEQIDMIAIGNHESCVERYHNVDPLMLLIYELEKALPKNSKHVIHHGGFTGFMDYRFRYLAKDEDLAKKPVGAKTVGAERLVIAYHHGSGGDAPVTHGMIDFNRTDVFITADIIWKGHKHHRLVDAVERIYCPIHGDTLQIRDVRHIMTGSYFKTYVAQSQRSIREHGRRSNYAADKGLASQGKGGARVEVRFGRNGYEMKVVQ